MLPRPPVKWSFEAPEPASVPAVIARAAHFAMAAPAGPVFVSIAIDDRCSEASSDQTPVMAARHVSAHPNASPAALQLLADRLNSSRNPLFVMGADVDTDPWLASRSEAGGAV